MRRRIIPPRIRYARLSPTWASAIRPGPASSPTSVVPMPASSGLACAISKMSREGVVTKEHNKAMQVTLRKLFNTFRNLPDFTWKVFEQIFQRTG